MVSRPYELDRSEAGVLFLIFEDSHYVLDPPPFGGAELQLHNTVTLDDPQLRNAGLQLVARSIVYS